MKKEYKLEEFHCASNKTQPVRIICEAPKPRGSLYKKVTAENDTTARKIMFTKARSNTICDIVKEPICVTPILNSKGQVVENTSFLFKPYTSDKSATVELKVPEEDKVADNVKLDLEAEIKRRSTDDSDTCKTAQTAHEEPVLPENTQVLKNSEAQLKEKLTESLSPSPFRNEDPGAREEKLERLVASTACPTKMILFSPFYGSELTTTSSHHAWKIALKDHIVHTIESICLIKKLKPVPSHILEKKRLPLEENKSSKSSIVMIEKKILVFDLDETLAHCVTEGVEKADVTITVPLNTGESVKV